MSWYAVKNQSENLEFWQNFQFLLQNTTRVTMIKYLKQKVKKGQYFEEKKIPNSVAKFSIIIELKSKNI